MKINHMKFAFCIMICLFSICFAKVTAKLDRSTLSEGESFTLIISLDDASPISPNLSLLEKNFSVISVSQDQRVSIVNGKTNSEANYYITLSPKKPGKLIIPSLDIQGQKTNPLTVEVKPLSQMLSENRAPPIFLMNQINRSKGYPDVQITLTTKLYSELPIESGTLDFPLLKNAKIEKLGDDRTYRARQGDRQFFVVERRFAIFPEKVGRYTINSPIFSGTIREQTRAFVPTLGKPVRISGNNENIKIISLPKSKYTSGFPAYNLILSQHWSSPDKNIPLGTPITRTIDIQATGIQEHTLPAISPTPSPLYKAYSEKPYIQTTINTDFLIQSEKQEKFVYIPVKPSVVTLPPINFHWLDVNKSMWRTRVVPGRTFNIVGAQTMPATPPTSPNATSTESFSSPLESLRQILQQHGFTLLISTLVATLAIVLWYFFNRFYFGTFEHTICRACKRNKPREVKTLLLAWGNTQFPHSKLISLKQLAQKIPSCENVLDELDAAIYQSQVDTSNTLPHWNGHAWWFKIKPIFTLKPAENSNKNNKLPPLHKID